MKKIISIALSCVLCVLAMSVTAFADVQANGGLFGVIIDADGSVVEVLPMPRTVYENSVYMIPAGGSFLSYQYEPTKNFLFGFDTRDNNGNYITAPNCTFDLTLQISSTIGADGKHVLQDKTIITGSAGNIGKGDTVGYTATSDRVYCNGILKNRSSVSTYVRIFVLMDYTNEEYQDVLNP